RGDEQEPVEVALAELRRVAGYPYRDEVDRQMIAHLIECNPRKDVPSEIRKWSAWLLDHPEITNPKARRNGKKRRTNWRARLTNWIEDGRGPTGDHRFASGGTGPETGAASAEAHGA